ncbi:MAG: hypothetical protein IJC16_05245 [Rikenellaceae bacterium]|nr:hypothetical protein [Rikenellaceae bacterium]
MKKQLFMAIVAAAALLAGCSDTKEGDGGDGGDDNTEGLVFEETVGGVTRYYIGDGDQNFPAPVKNYTLDASKTYYLRGWVYIQDGSSITIPAGTVIRGDKGSMGSLIIERGGKIFAQGTPSKPVVFTSAQPAGQRKPGDWGGLIICGRALNNKTEQQIEGGPRTFHGGNDNADNSGVLSYVRVEFAGYPFGTDMEINGITFGSVGSGTKVDHLQVSYSNDDSYEWFGGAVSCSYLVAYHGWDDDFDTDNGFSGNMQFLLGVRHPRLADTSLSNGFESDNNKEGSDEQPYTTARFSNVTLIGPMGQDPDFYNTSASTANPDAYINGGALFPNNGSKLGQFQSGVQIRRNSRISLYNSVITGYPVGMIVENDKGNSQGAATDGKFVIRNVHFAGVDTTATAFDNSVANVNPLQGILGSNVNKTWTRGTGFTDGYVRAAANANRFYTALNGVQFVQPNSLQAGFKPMPAAGSPLVDASYTVPAGFDTRGNGYAGAFRSADPADDWTAGWCEWDPQNAEY